MTIRNYDHGPGHDTNFCDDAPERGPVHVRINVKRAGRRIGDSRGSAGETLCGAPITAYDSTWSEARRYSAANLKQWITCPACRAGVENVCTRQKEHA